MENKITTGVFDSGVGGLSVLKKIMLNGGNYIYFGDTKNLPYGNKTKEEIIFFTRNIINFFIEKNATQVVMACNTSSALAYEVLQKEFKDKIKIFPLIQTAAPKIATSGKKIGIMATEATYKSRAYTKELLKYNRNLEILEIPCPKFVPIVENKLYDKKESIDNIKKTVREFVNFKADRVILGCTHYPYLLPIMTKYAPRELFTDPADYMAEKIQKSNTPLNIEFYVSDNPDKFVDNAKIFMDIKSVHKIDLQ